MKKMSGWYLWSWEGAVKGESFLHPGKPLHQWEDWPGQKKSLRGEYRNWFTEPDWRENCTDGQRALLHSLAWDSCPLVQTSSGHWDSGFGDPTQGEDWDWMDRSRKVGLELQLRVYMEKPRLSTRSGAIVWVGGAWRGGVGPAIVAFLHVHMFTECRTSSAQV